MLKKILETSHVTKIYKPLREGKPSPQSNRLQLLSCELKTKMDEIPE